MDTLAEIVGMLDADASLVVITKWSIEDALAGASDPSCFSLVSARANSRYLTRSDLHAKFYRFDRQVFLGSANLTRRGLGTAGLSNLELVVDLGDAADAFTAFEATAFANTFEPTQADFELFTAALLEAKANLPLVPALAECAVVPPGQPTPRIDATNQWFELRDPSDIERAYLMEDGLLARGVGPAARRIVAEFGIPPGLSNGAFKGAVALALMQSGLVRRIDKVASTGARFGAVADCVQNFLGCNRQEAKYFTQTVFRWLLYFLPERFSRSRANYSEILRVS